MSVTRIDNTEQLKRQIFDGLEKGLLLSAELLTTKISDFTPVLTGLLKSQNRPIESVEKTNDGMKTKVINKTEYAINVEFGTASQRARGMFRQGGGSAAKAIGKILKLNLPH